MREVLYLLELGYVVADLPTAQKLVLLFRVEDSQLVVDFVCDH